MANLRVALSIDCSPWHCLPASNARSMRTGRGQAHRRHCDRRSATCCPSEASLLRLCAEDRRADGHNLVTICGHRSGNLTAFEQARLQPLKFRRQIALDITDPHLDHAVVTRLQPCLPAGAVGDDRLRLVRD